MTRLEALQGIAAYHAGELNPEERRKVFAEILADQDLYNAFAEQQIVSELLSDPILVREVSAGAQQTKYAGWRWPKLSWLWRCAAASVAVLLGLAVHRYFQAGIPHPQIAQYKSAGKGKLGPTSTAANHGGRGVAPQPPPQDASTNNGDLLALVLAPTPRGGGLENVLSLKPSVRTVLLQAPLEVRANGVYSVALSSADGKNIRTFSGVRPVERDRKFIALQIPARLLTAGDYALIISTNDEQGRKQSVGGYSFRVVVPTKLRLR